MTHTLDRPRKAVRGRRALTALVAATAMTAAGALAATPAYAADPTLTGTLTYSDDDPATDVYVELIEPDGDYVDYDYTDIATGEYDFGSVDPGTYTLRFYPNNGDPHQYLGGVAYLAQAQTFTLAEDDTEVLDVELSAGQPITGKVTRAGGAPHGDRYVAAYLWSGDFGSFGFDQVQSTMTEPDGTYKLPGVLPGTYTVWVEGDGEHTSQYYGNVYEEEDAKTFTTNGAAEKSGIDITVPKAAKVKGVVRDRNNAPLDDVEVDVYRVEVDAFGYERLVSEDDDDTEIGGDYEIDGLPAGTYTLRFSAKGYPQQWLGGVTARGGAARFSVGPGETKTVDYRLTDKPFVAPSVVAVSTTKARYGTAATATVTVKSVKGTPTGSVALTVDGKAVGTKPVAAGSAAFTLPKKLKVGKHTLKATFTTTGDVKSGTATKEIVVAKAKAKVKTDVNKAKTAVDVTVKAKGVKAKGEVTLKLGKKTLDSSELSKKGKATLSLDGVSGKKKLRVVYSGSKKVAKGSKKFTVKVG